MLQNIPQNIADLYSAAVTARLNAHCPYSKFQVGAALRIKGSDTIYSGCNIENVSFGATICGERSAIFNAVAKNGKIEIEHLVVITDTNPVATPCGMCRQVMAEFASSDTPIYIANLQGVQKVMRLDELLPEAFNDF